jgi:AraC family ethanolamine operon transcriptional activator
MLDQLLSSRVLTINRSADFDHFRNIERLGDAKSIPLSWRNFAAGFAAVTLKSCSIYLQRTFPRILQTRYIASGAIVAFAMDDAVSVIINGIEVRQPSLLLVKGEAPCEIVEPQANLIVFVKFDAIDGRGWPGEPGRAHLIPIQLAGLAALRSVTRDILLLASNSADLLLQSQVVNQLEESLLHAVDQTLQRSSALDDGGRADLSQYLLLVRKLDEYLHDNPGKTPHSMDIASDLGVSVRTLNNAVVAIRGLSMHRYTSYGGYGTCASNWCRGRRRTP